MSLDSGEVPELWRQANIVMKSKKGDKMLPSNYRPVSLTSVERKFMESVIAKKIRGHLEKHNLISTRIYIRKIVLNKLLSFYSRVYDAVDNG